MTNRVLFRICFGNFFPNMGLKNRFVTFVILFFVYDNDRKLATCFPSNNESESKDVSTVVTETLPDDGNYVVYDEENFVEFEDQLPGRNRRKKGFLLDRQGRVWKPHPFEREINFFETVKDADRNDRILVELYNYIPKYLGVYNLKKNDKIQKYIVMQNIMDGYKKPCSLDAKIGKVRKGPWENELTDEEANMYMGTMQWSFGLTGLKYHDIKEGDIKQKGKDFGYFAQASEVIQIIYQFMNGKIGIKCKVVQKMLDQLKRIKDWNERQRHFRFYDGSIFLTYDAEKLEDAVTKEILPETKVPEVVIKCDNIDVPVNVHMIDFDKTMPVPDSERDQQDDNFLDGLKGLMYVLENLEELYKKHFGDDDED